MSLISTGTPLFWVNTTFSMSSRLIAPCQIVVAAIIDQADPANIDRLLAYADFATTNVQIGIGERFNSCVRVRL